MICSGFQFRDGKQQGKGLSGTGGGVEWEKMNFESEKMEMENSKRREGKGKRSEVFLDGESEKMEIVWKR